MILKNDINSHQGRIYGLLDCNSFFASCEKLFRPDLRNKPVVVLSNNDGCVVARSSEAKKLGIPMGEPYFKIKNFVQRNRVHVFSSNFRLYGDISGRIMRLLYRWTPNVEIYSIDEAFLEFSGLGTGNPPLESLSVEILSSISRWVGIPVSLGIGPTKTLSKLANDIAKKSSEKPLDFIKTPGICNLLDPEIRKAALACLPIGDVWGIGRRLVVKMERLGLRTAADLARLDPRWVRKEFTIVQEQLVRELNGEPCLEVDNVPSPKKSIQVSRSFHDATNDFTTLSEAVSSFAGRACEKARAQGSVASGIYVHINTGRFKEGYCSDGRAKGFPIPTANSPEVIKTALSLLAELYRPGELYKKATVILMELHDATAAKAQGTLFPLDEKSPEQREKEDRLMDSMDRINRLMGRGTLIFGSHGLAREWRGASDHCSPAYTSLWSEIPVAKAK